MAKKSMLTMPHSMRESTEKAQGIRDSHSEMMDMEGSRDSGDARSLGPKRAARVLSPTRERKRSRVYERRV